MDMDVAAAFLGGSILFGLGFIIFVAVIVVINNLLHRFWKPVKFFTFEEGPKYKFIDEKSDEQK